MNIFLDYNIVRLNQEETGNLNRLNTSNEIEAVVNQQKPETR